MDTSKEYIKLCDCPEIQSRGFENNYGFIDAKFQHSYYACKECGEILAEDNGYYFKSRSCDDHGGKVWLPTQDQLQTIYEKLTGCGWVVFDNDCSYLLNNLEFANPGNFFTKEYVGVNVVLNNLRTREEN